VIKLKLISIIGGLLLMALLLVGLIAALIGLALGFIDAETGIMFCFGSTAVLYLSMEMLSFGL
jgi:hypothetical protein